MDKSINQSFHPLILCKNYFLKHNKLVIILPNIILFGINYYYYYMGIMEKERKNEIARNEISKFFQDINSSKKYKI